MQSELSPKDNGIYYTPEDLALFLAYQIIDSSQVEIFDPCFGKGSLLKVAIKVLKTKYKAKQAYKQIYGCDVNPLCFNEIPSSIKKVNLVEYDFLNINQEQLKKFDVIIMNPPFVRHHRLDKKLNKGIIDEYKKHINLSKKADLWCYFVLKSFQFLKNDGNIGLILPWSFVFTDYSERIRKLFSENFSTIRMILINSHLFNDNKERVIVLFAKGFGKMANDIKISYLHKVPRNNFSNYRAISTEKWLNNPFIYAKNSRTSSLLKSLSEIEDWKPLSTYSKISIGVVTGANSYFILSSDNVKKKKIPKKYLKHIVNTSGKLQLLKVGKFDCEKYLLVLNSQKVQNKNIQKYIKEMKNADIHKREHSKKRNPWYSIKTGKVPDAFLPYMFAESPGIVFNPDHIQCSNNIHKIFFKKELTELERKWIRLSFFSSISQFSIESNCRTYGSGVLKLEPSEAGRILVHTGGGCKIAKSIEDKIYKYLKRGEREKAIEFATEYCIKKLKIDLTLARQANKFRKILRKQRKLR